VGGGIVGFAGEEDLALSSYRAHQHEPNALGHMVSR
jgi:hypothetical protein